MLRLFLFAVWAVIMTSLTYVLGAPALKVLRRRAGRAGYWAFITLLSAALYAAQAKLLGLAFFSLGTLMGVFDEFEEMGFSFTVSSFFTLLINSLLSGGAFALWVSHIGPHWSQRIGEWMQATLKPVTDFNPALAISYQDLMQQLPSVTLIIWIIALYLAVLLEGRLLGAMSAEAQGQPIPSMRPQLATLRLPDACVWLFIAALLGTFGGFDKTVMAISINVLNVCIVLFFFQGIAVVARFFETLRLGMFWQVLFMVIMVVQLFLFVSVLGLMDFWLGFRARLEKRAGEFNQET